MHDFSKWRRKLRRLQPRTIAVMDRQDSQFQTHESIFLSADSRIFLGQLDGLKGCRRSQFIRFMLLCSSCTTDNSSAGKALLMLRFDQVP